VNADKEIDNRFCISVYLSPSSIIVTVYQAENRDARGGKESFGEMA
jgi:hypothetical protein